MYDFLKNKGVFETLKEGKVIDIGSGEGKDGKEFEEKGFNVTYVDKTLGTDAITFEYPKNFFDIAIAKNSLPFMGGDQEAIMSKIYNSLKVDGYFFGTVFGHKDPWAIEGKITAVDFEEIKTYLKKIGFDILWFSEEEGIGKTMKGDLKNWHILKFLCKKI